MAKIIQFSEIVRICEQKKQTGDIQTLSKMLGYSTDAIRMRLSRKDKKTYEALYELIEQRECLITKYQENERIS
nr:MAG TPA: RNA polymerase sigma-E factor [Caudoviricetes sp.]